MDIEWEGSLPQMEVEELTRELEGIEDGGGRSEGMDLSDRPQVAHLLIESPLQRGGAPVGCGTPREYIGATANRLSFREAANDGANESNNPNLPPPLPRTPSRIERRRESNRRHRRSRRRTNDGPSDAEFSPASSDGSPTPPRLTNLPPPDLYSSLSQAEREGGDGGGNHMAPQERPSVSDCLAAWDAPQHPQQAPVNRGRNERGVTRSREGAPIRRVERVPPLASSPHPPPRIVLGMPVDEARQRQAETTRSVWVPRAPHNLPRPPPPPPRPSTMSQPAQEGGGNGGRGRNSRGGRRGGRGRGRNSRAGRGRERSGHPPNSPPDPPDPSPPPGAHQRGSGERGGQRNPDASGGGGGASPPPDPPDGPPPDAQGAANWHRARKQLPQAGLRVLSSLTEAYDEELFKEGIDSTEVIPGTMRASWLEVSSAVRKRMDETRARTEGSAVEEGAHNDFETACLVNTYLPALLLMPVGRGGNAGRMAWILRFRRFWSGEWELLLNDTKQQQANEREARRQREAREARERASTQRPQRSEDEEREIRERSASRLLGRGEISKAAKRLTGDSPAPRNQETLVALGLLHPSRDPIVWPQSDDNNTHPLLVDDAALLLALRSAPRGSAPGPTGWRYEHLRAIYGEASRIEEAVPLAPFVRTMIEGKLPERCAKILSAARLHALSKPNGGVRPIAVGDVLRRWVTRAVCRDHKETFEADFAPLQFAVGVSGGAEKLSGPVRHTWKHRSTPLRGGP